MFYSLVWATAHTVLYFDDFCIFFSFFLIIYFNYSNFSIFDLSIFRIFYSNFEEIILNSDKFQIINLPHLCLSSTNQTYRYDLSHFFSCFFFFSPPQIYSPLGGWYYWHGTARTSSNKTTWNPPSVPLEKIEEGCSSNDATKKRNCCL